MACTTITIPALVATGTVPGTSAAPGFQFGRAGDVFPGTYLQAIATVPTNTAGIEVTFDGLATKAWTTNENANTYTLRFEKRLGAVFTTLFDLVVVANRKGRVLPLIAVADFDEIVCFLFSGFARNIQAGVILEQNP